MRNRGKHVLTAGIGAAILMGAWAAGPPLDEYLPPQRFNALEAGPLVSPPDDDDLSVPADPNCTLPDPRLLRMPWDEVERAARWEPAREGTRVLAYAVARTVYERGWGAAFVVAREADGTISLYRVEGGPHTIRNAYSLAVGARYMRAVSPWHVVARASTLDELLTWMEQDISGVGTEALSIFNGGRESWGRQYISRSDERDDLER